MHVNRCDLMIIISRIIINTFCCITTGRVYRDLIFAFCHLTASTLLIYGSPMGNGNLHNHKRVPMFLAGHAGGKLKGRSHVKAPDGTPAANMYLTLLQKLGLDDLTVFGDSTGTLAL